jgi:hypothetical protein
MNKKTTIFRIFELINCSRFAVLGSLLIIAVAFSSCEERELVSPQDPTKRGKTNYLQSTYDYRQDGSAVLEELGISDDSNKNVSFNTGTGSQSSATDKGDDNNDTGNGDGNGDDGITDKDGDDDDEDGESSSTD